MALVYQDGEKTILPARLVKEFEKLAEESQDHHGFGWKPGQKKPWNRHKYPYIPLYHRQFTDVIKPLLQPSMRVIDVGCGAGDKLYMFHKLCRRLHITGLEYDKTLVDHAKRLCGKFADIVHQDARKHNYEPYDLIYMYRPMSDIAGQTAIQERVIKTMRPGATLVVLLQQCGNNRTGYAFPMLDRGWVKPEGYNPRSERKLTQHRIAI